VGGPKATAGIVGETLHLCHSSLAKTHQGMNERPAVANGQLYATDTSIAATGEEITRTRTFGDGGGGAWSSTSIPFFHTGSGPFMALARSLSLTPDLVIMVDFASSRQR